MKAFDRIVVASLPVVPRIVMRRIADRYIAGEGLERRGGDRARP